MTDEFYMNVALSQAKIAFNKGEVPIGAVIVKGDKIISKAYNKRENSQNALYHAEILAIYKACKKLKSWRLDGCIMYCTVEPCVMCAGAIVNARISKLVFGVQEQKSGAVINKFSVLDENGLNHKTEFLGGLLEEQCKKILQDFFVKLRSGEKYKKNK